MASLARSFDNLTEEQVNAIHNAINKSDDE